MKPFEIAGLPPDEVNRFVGGAHSDPFRVLGPHRVGDDLEIRVFRPDARKIEIVTGSTSGRADRSAENSSGRFFCATVRNATRDLPYHLRVTAWDGSHYLTRDPYSTGRSWAKSICIFSPKDSTGRFTTSSARILRTDRRCDAAFISRSGRRTRSASAWSAISMAGMAGSIRCAN